MARDASWAGGGCAGTAARCAEPKSGSAAAQHDESPFQNLGGEITAQVVKPQSRPFLKPAIARKSRAPTQSRTDDRRYSSAKVSNAGLRPRVGMEPWQFRPFLLHRRFGFGKSTGFQWELGRCGPSRKAHLKVEFTPRAAKDHGCACGWCRGQLGIGHS